MTRDEIIKALKRGTADYCVCHHKQSYPASEDYIICTNIFKRDVLKLITEQEQEIEYLKAQVEDVTNHADTLLEEASKFEAEIQRLENEKKQAKIEVLERVRNSVLAMPSNNGAVISQQGLNILIDELIEEVKAE